MSLMELTQSAVVDLQESPAFNEPFYVVVMEKENETESKHNESFGYLNTPASAYINEAVEGYQHAKSCHTLAFVPLLFSVYRPNTYVSKCASLISFLSTSGVLHDTVIRIFYSPEYIKVHDETDLDVSDAGN